MKTICALATAPMNCAIHIIRLSGPNAYQIINKIVDKEVKKENFKIVRRFIVDSNMIKIDDVLLNLFSNPKSYTGEDLIEINCHGGIYLANKIISLLIKNGATYAKPGEFSQRSLLNKKIDFSQVEAINNLVLATNDIAIRAATNVLSGATSDILKDIKTKLFKIIGQIEINIDYPEFDDVPQISNNEVIELLKEISQKLSKLLIESKRFIPLNQGIKVAIIGKPNAGKSTLLNTLCQEEKAIVTDIPGTTRDIVEAIVNIDGITLKLLDTAGIRFDSNDLVEKMGIQKTIDVISQADLILWLTQYNDVNDIQIKKFLENKNYLNVITKKDLIQQTELRKYIEQNIVISAKNNDISNLIEKIKEKFYYFDFESNSNIQVLQSQRQIDMIEYVLKLIDKSLFELENNYVTLDLIATDLEIAHKEINVLLGLDLEYDFLDELFKNFCIGK